MQQKKIILMLVNFKFAYVLLAAFKIHFTDCVNFKKVVHFSTFSMNNFMFSFTWWSRTSLKFIQHKTRKLLHINVSLSIKERNVVWKLKIEIYKFLLKIFLLKMCFLFYKRILLKFNWLNTFQQIIIIFIACLFLCLIFVWLNNSKMSNK